MIDFTTALTGFDGAPIYDELSPIPKTPLTLGAAARNALCASFPDERDLDGVQKFNRAKLALSIIDNPSIALKSDEITLLKRLIGKLYTPVVVFRSYVLLDPAEDPATSR